MIRINVKEVLVQAELEKKNPRPLPKVSIRIKGTSEKIPDPPPQQADDSDILDADYLVSQLEQEYAEVRLLCNIESSKIFGLVEAGASKEDLRIHYERIESFGQIIQDKYDQIAYAKKHGQIPEVKREPHHEHSLFELKDRKRKLIDKRCKLQVKLKPSAKPSKAIQVATWQMELDQCTAEYDMIDIKIKQLEGRA